MNTFTATQAAPPRPRLVRLFANATFTQLSAVWLLLLLLLRVGEFVLNGIPAQFGQVLLQGLRGDLVFFLRSTFFLGILYFVFALVSARAAKAAYITAVVLLTAAQVGLMYYFSQTSVPLGADLYGYSWDEMQQTVGAAGGLSWPVGLAAVLLVVLVVGAFRLLAGRIPVGERVSPVLLVLSGLAVWLKPSTLLGTPRFESEYARNLAANKSLHLVTASTEYFFAETNDPTDIYADAHFGDTDDIGGNSLAVLNYLNENQFPFLHRNETPDVLGPFFKPSPVRPNVVLIIVESLGRAFTGEDAYLGNFTPFIDSLSRQSLYWQNILSVGGRTFAVLPSMLGSLPLARKGFADLGEAMPAPVSVASVLKKSGYRTNFYYGGDATFDNMRTFMRKNGVDRIVEEASFGPGFQKMPAENGFTWGYGDKALFANFLKLNPPADSTPQFHVVLTVSTHSPFLINEQDKYLARFEQRLAQLPLSEDKKAARRKYRRELASVLYLDDALRGFITAYRQRPDFENTIFLITGDHRMPEIPMTTLIDRFHVPLLVYSPRLSRTAEFQSVSSHFDVGPSLLAYFQKNYGVQIPTVASWLGTGLDTTRVFRNVHAYPLMMTKTETVDYVMGPYLLNRGNLYKISESLGLDPVREPDQQSRLSGAFDRFKQKNQKFIDGAKLVPDSVQARFGF